MIFNEKLDIYISYFVPSSSSLLLSSPRLFNNNSKKKVYNSIYYSVVKTNMREQNREQKNLMEKK